MNFFCVVVFLFTSFTSLQALAMDPKFEGQTTVLAGFSFLPYSALSLGIEQEVGTGLSATLGFARGQGRFMMDDIRSDEISLGLKKNFDSFYYTGRLTHRSTSNTMDYFSLTNGRTDYHQKEWSNEVDLDVALGNQWAMGLIKLDCEWAGAGVAVLGKKEERKFENRIKTQDESSSLFLKGFPIILKVRVGYAF